MVNVAVEVKWQVEEGDLKEAWRWLKRWYMAVEDGASKHDYRTMAKETVEQEELHRRLPPWGDPIPINVDPISVNMPHQGY